MYLVLKVRKSGYYRFRKRTKVPEKEDILLAEIKKSLSNILIITTTEENK